MDVNEALQFADEWAKSQTFYEGMQGWRVVCAVLAAEVRRLRVPAVEAVPVGYALANLDGTIRNHGDGELMVYRNPFSRSDKTDCIPLYTHPPALDVCNMEYMGNSVGYIYQKMEAYRQQLGKAQGLDDDTKKLQSLLSENARLSILNHLYEQISAGREEFSAMDMDYWDSSHDKLLEAIQNKLDDDTRKLVLELLDELDTYSLDPYLSRRSKEIVKILKEKLGAGE